jgi:hypothetical protein
MIVITPDPRESFRQVNASCAIEGMVMTAEDLALQERVIQGELTHDEAIAEARKAFDIEAPTSTGTGSMPAP